VNELRTALEVPRWAWRFYVRNLGVVVGLSLVASAQRLVVVNWTDKIPEDLAFASEVVVLAVRVALVVVIWRFAMRDVTLRWQAFRGFLKVHWQSLVWQGVLLAGAFGVFEVLAEHVAGGLLPESARQTYLAVLLFAKNPTVIALTMIWLIGLIRQSFRVPDPQEAGPVGTSTSRR
jgi:hypothetical protein